MTPRLFSIRQNSFLACKKFSFSPTRSLLWATSLGTLLGVYSYYSHYHHSPQQNLIHCESQQQNDHSQLQNTNHKDHHKSYQYIPLSQLPLYFEIEDLMYRSKTTHHHCLILRHKDTNERAILNVWFNSDDIESENALWNLWEQDLKKKDNLEPSFQIDVEHPPNDKYRRWSAFAAKKQKYEFELIFPCSEWDIMKATPKEDFIVQETSHMYTHFTKPKIIDPITPAREKWIFNILDGSAEQDDVIAQNHEFMLLPNPRFRSGKKEDFQGLLFFKTHSNELRSIRDLDASHVQLLERAQSFVEHTLQENYDLPPTKYRCFFHYHPSFWRIHLHVTPLSAPVGHSTLHMDRARTLQEIISELKRDGDYCKEASFQIVVYDPKVVRAMKEAKILQSDGGGSGDAGTSEATH